MATLEKTFEKPFELTAELLDPIIRECLGPCEAYMERSHMETGDSCIEFWTGSCVYFGGREVTLSCVLARDNTGCKLTVHATPGMKASSVETKLIRKFSDKINKAGF